MHFDEVYHARTATEFLQDWRYGIPHEIYECTHPHLAKYAMAGGIVAWGDDRDGTSDLGVPVRRPRSSRAGTDATSPGSLATGCTSRPGRRSAPTTSRRGRSSRRSLRPVRRPSPSTGRTSAVRRDARATS